MADEGLSPVIAVLEDAYAKLVEHFSLQTEGPAPMITIASRGRKRTVSSWYSPAVWEDSDDKVLAVLAGNEEALVKRAEIVVAGEVIHDPYQAIAEVARQAVAHHVPALRAGETHYYREDWKYWGPRIACSIGVNPDQPSRGWSRLEPTEDFRKWVADNLDLTPFRLEREANKAQTRKGSRMKKWRCQCTTVRCATRLTATCYECKAQFTWAEPTEVSPWGDAPVGGAL